jgi:hypothetical protein
MHAHVPTSDLILCGFVAGCVILSLLAEFNPRRRRDREDGADREPARDDVSLAA